MARLSGVAGSVFIGTSTTQVAGIKSWSLDYTKDLLDSTGFDSTGTREFVLGFSDWKGTFEGYKDGTPIALATATITLNLKESTTTGQNWTGAAYITGIHPSASFDGLVSYSYDFQGSGALTVATA